VLVDAWVSDDALITFRYVDNFLHGHGAVFNPGERVQGYTHPLWFLLLSVTTAVSHDEVWSAVVLGLACTVLTCLAVTGGYMAAGRETAGEGGGWTGLAIGGLVLALLAISDSWRSFQTSGLETSLTTLLLTLLVLELRPGESLYADSSSSSPSPSSERGARSGGVVVASSPKSAVVLLLGVLLVLTRPDLGLIAGPPCLVALYEVYRRRTWPDLLAGLPLLWFAFARLYYHDFLPNTGAAKLGIFTFSQAVDQGWTYLKDWVSHEPSSAGAALAFFGIAAVRVRSRHEIAVLLGLLAYVAYVLVIGGDFMRGRFCIPVFVTSLVMGGVVLVRNFAALPARRFSLAAGAVAFLVILTGPFIEPEIGSDRTIPESGIVNERGFYWPGYSFASYRKQHRLINPAIDSTVVQEFRRYVDKCGSITIHSKNPSYLGYLVGPKMTLIDTHGLTDRFIARLPNDALIERPPRPGHPDWFIPVKYLASRGDVSLLPDWQQGVKDLDCDMTKRVEPLLKSDAKVKP